MDRKGSSATARTLEGSLAGALVLALSLSAPAAPPLRDTAPEEDPTTARVTRIEAGLLPPIVFRGDGTERMSLSARLHHYQASALSLAVIDDYQVAWARAWGTLALDQPDEATAESLFQAGSVSKPVAALVAAALVRKGELSLDRPLAALLERRAAIRETVGGQVRLRHLLAHTAGVPAHSWHGWDRDEELPSTVGMLGEADLSPTAPPGEEVRYSNTGYLLLQLAIEDATGRSFSQVAEQELFAPLGMTRSSFQEPLPKPLWEAAVWGHSRGEPVPGKGRTYPAAPAGLWTTPADLARAMAEVLRAMSGRSAAVVPAGLAHDMIAPVLPGAARSLAWSVEGEGKETRIFHAGQVAGFTAYVVGYPERGQGLAVMSNSDRSHALNLEVARAVAVEYGWPGFVEERDRVHLAEEDLRRFEGRFEYESPAGRVITFTQRDGTLFGRTGDNPEWEVLPIGDREFVTSGGSAVIRFEVDERGRVTGFRIGVPGGNFARVHRVE